MALASRGRPTWTFDFAGRYQFLVLLSSRIRPRLDAPDRKEAWIVAGARTSHYNSSPFPRRQVHPLSSLGSPPIDGV